MLSLVAYFETLLQLSLHLCQFSVFLHIEAQLFLKNARLPQLFFFDFNSP